MPFIGSVPPQAALTSANIADGAVNSDEIATGAVDLAHLSASGTAGSGNFLRGDNSWQTAGGGKLVAIKAVEATAATTVTASSFADCTGMSLAHAQSAAGNYLLITGTASMLANSGNGTTQRRPWVRISRYDGSSDTEIAVQSFNIITDNAGSSNIYHNWGQSIVAYHSTGNTTSYTYKVQIKTQSGVSANESVTWNNTVSGASDAILQILEFEV